MLGSCTALRLIVTLLVLLILELERGLIISRSLSSRVHNDRHRLRKGVVTASRVKLKADPNEGVGTVNADVVEERVLETRGSEGEDVDQPRTAVEKDPGVVVGEGSVEELALVCKLVGGSSPKCCPFVDDGVCSPV